MGRIAQCAIYDERPRECQEYPQPGHYRPNACTFWFDDDGGRHGECASECAGTCCAIPREGGEPGGAAMPALAGGEPCKHLTFVEEDMDQQKTAAAAATALRGLYEEGLDAIFDEHADDAGE